MLYNLTWQWGSRVESTSYSNSGDMALQPAPVELELGAPELIIMRVEK